ncbi:MAG: hypothetical protein IT432_01415 [Phycisphaerales bacterium]|nr:hypothetical protein [Phycisphaerales bacterium]
MRFSQIIQSYVLPAAVVLTIAIASTPLKADVINVGSNAFYDVYDMKSGVFRDIDGNGSKEWVTGGAGNEVFTADTVYNGPTGQNFVWANTLTDMATVGSDLYGIGSGGNIQRYGFSGSITSGVDNANALAMIENGGQLFSLASSGSDNNRVLRNYTLDQDIATLSGNIASAAFKYIGQFGGDHFMLAGDAGGALVYLVDLGSTMQGWDVRQTFNVNGMSGGIEGIDFLPTANAYTGRIGLVSATSTGVSGDVALNVPSAGSLALAGLGGLVAARRRRH